MPKRRPVRVPRDQSGSLDLTSYGRKGAPLGGSSPASWASHMSASQAGAQEVLVKISGGGRDADGVQAHFEYIDRHGKLEIETDDGEVLQGKQAGTELINDWALDYGEVPGAPHSRKPVGPDGERKKPRAAFNIVLSMPAGTPPAKVLQAVKKFAREEFAHQHRYAMALHADHPNGHGKNPHVHLVVKAEHEYGGKRLSPRKADLRRWREQFAQALTELGVPATATRRYDRGLTKTTTKTGIVRATERQQRGQPIAGASPGLYTEAGDSVFMRKKLERIKKELRETGTVEDRAAHRALLNVRAQVNERYAQAIDWLRSQGRESEAHRFELLQRHLPPVRTEKQLIAEALVAEIHTRAGPEIDQGRTR
jgi:hypothetical protein